MHQLCRTVAATMTNRDSELKTGGKSITAGSAGARTAVMGSNLVPNLLGR